MQTSIVRQAWLAGAFAVVCGSASAQVLYNQEALTTQTGVGAGGADVSEDTSGVWGYDIGRYNAPAQVGTGPGFDLLIDLDDLPTNIPGSQQT